MTPSKPSLGRATCARLPTSALAALAGLRRDGGIGVIEGPARSWVFWEPGDDRAVRAVLPVAGVELFEDRDGRWHRPGQHLPSFEAGPEGSRRPLLRVVTPAPFSAEPPPTGPLAPVRLHLARAPLIRPTAAATCPLAGLARWAEMAPTAEIGAIRGALAGDLALLLGDHLPAWPGSERYWGRSLLVPLGWEPRPALPEGVLREALGAGDGDLLRLVPAGPDGGEAGLEKIPLAAFHPLTRAGVRLALARREDGR